MKNILRVLRFLFHFLPFIFHLLFLLAFTATHAQTHYGTSAGTQGIGHSYFGNFAGNAALNTSYENSFFGAYSGRFTTTGFGNTAIGFNSLRNNTTGYWNTALGTFALFQNTTGFRNTATGRMALYSNAEGSYNVANGFNALLLNTSGNDNTAIGSQTLYENTTGYYNTATGSRAMYSNISGNSNVATGNSALATSTTGSFNTATGAFALLRSTTGSNNTATGHQALAITTTGSNNCAFGTGALVTATGSSNSAFGAYSLNSDGQFGCTGSFNSAFGAQSGPPVFQACDYNNTTALGALSVITASNQVRIGNSSVTSIGGQVSWTTLSDGRFKRDIRKDVSGLDFINALNPVSYTLDKTAINKFLKVQDSQQLENSSMRTEPRRQVGFVAQEVEAIIKKSGYVFSGVEAPQNENDPYTIRYSEFVVPLVKAVQELSAQVEDLKLQLKKYANEPTPGQKNTVGAVLYQNSPNPFSTNTTIQMDIPDAFTNASVIVYNLEGKQLKNITVNERGSVSVNITGNELSAGMYLYTLMVDGKVVDTKRLVLTN